MTQNTQNPDGLQVALLTVHVEPAVVEQIGKSASQMPWAMVCLDYVFCPVGLA